MKGRAGRLGESHAPRRVRAQVGHQRPPDAQEVQDVVERTALFHSSICSRTV